MSNPNEDLAQGNRTGLVQWPRDLQSAENSKQIMFDIYDYQKDGPSSKEIAEPQESITLPLPAQLSQEDSLQWQNVDAAFVESIRDQLNDPDWEQFKNQAGELVRQVAGQIIGDEGQIVRSTTTGKVTNPRTLVGFERVDFRQHSFDFKMIARSEQESEDIKEIIYLFRQNSHPKLIDGEIQYRIPKVFNIQFVPRELNGHLYKPGICILTSVSVSYGDEGGLQLFADSNQPVEVNLSLQFQELLVQTADTIAQQKGIQ